MIPSVPVTESIAIEAGTIEIVQTVKILPRHLIMREPCATGSCIRAVDGIHAVDGVRAVYRSMCVCGAVGGVVSETPPVPTCMVDHGVVRHTGMPGDTLRASVMNDTWMGKGSVHCSVADAQVAGANAANMTATQMSRAYMSGAYMSCA